MSPRFADSPEFQRLLSGADDVDLARVALEISRDAYPAIDIDFYLERIHRLTDRVRARFKPGSIAREILGQINWVLFVEEDFRGNKEDYYDPRNSYLNEVLERGLGIPITLSLVYKTIAQSLGLAAVGIALPMHFMIRVEDGDKTCFVDAFNGGAVYDREACERKVGEIAQQPVILSDAAFKACSSLDFISRMLRNLKAIYGQSGELVSALPIQRRLTAINRDDPGELRDLGILCVQSDRLGEAIEPLQSYLEVAPDATDAAKIRDLLVGLRREVSRWN